MAGCHGGKKETISCITNYGNKQEPNLNTADYSKVNSLNVLLKDYDSSKIIKIDKTEFFLSGFTRAHRIQ